MTRRRRVTSSQPIGESCDLDIQDRVCLRELGAALHEGVLDDAAEIVDRVNLDTGQVAGSRVDIPRNREIEQQQWHGAGAPAFECAP
jgi:hypothetical protein